MVAIDPDPPVRRLALVHWTGDRWRLVVAIRCIDERRARSALEARAREATGPWRVLDLEGRAGAVEAAVAALGPYVSRARRPASADLVGVRMAMFQGDRR